MKIEIERSGGFAGFTRGIIVESKDLPRSLAKLLEQSLANKKPSVPLTSNKNKSADCYHFKVSNCEGKKKIDIEFNELDLDKELRSLMNNLFKKVT